MWNLADSQRFSVRQQLRNAAPTDCRAAGRLLVPDGQGWQVSWQILTLEREGGGGGVVLMCLWQYRYTGDNIDILVIPPSGDTRSASKRRGFACKFKHRLEQLQDSFIKELYGCIGIILLVCLRSVENVIYF